MAYLIQIYFQLPMGAFILIFISRKWQIQGRGPSPPLFLDQTEARRAEKIFWRPLPFPPPPPPSYLKVWIRQCQRPENWDLWLTWRPGTAETYLILIFDYWASQNNYWNFILHLLVIAGWCEVFLGSWKKVCNFTI